MATFPANKCVEFRYPGYYLAGTRISLDSIAYAVRRGDSVEQILADFPALASRHKLECAIAFIEAHPEEFDTYLAQKAELWKEGLKRNSAAAGA